VALHTFFNDTATTEIYTQEQGAGGLGSIVWIMAGTALHPRFSGNGADLDIRPGVVVKTDS
jgi:uncharacterized protein YigE (DUF2233 family)